QANRSRELAERGVIAAAKLEEDEATLSVAEANLRSQQENLAIGLAGGRPEEIEAAEAAIRGLEAQLQVARNNLDYATLEAPFDGIIARRDVDNFSNIQAGQSIVLLQALSVVHLAFDVPGPDVTDLTANGPSAITNEVVFDALPDQVFPSETVEFSVQANSATQTYRGRVAVELPEETFILPGMVGSVIATAPGEQTGLSIPLTAVAAQADGASFVWLVGDGGIVSARPVTLGRADGSSVAVTDGLAAGETIVSAGVGQIVEGMRIRPITQVGG
ncbi:MAG: efflux RND transporter periplasmic adaptor subunit, partial [Pseudomonadota bacterium]